MLADDRAGTLRLGGCDRTQELTVLVHAGDYDSISDTYRTLGAWVARNAEHADQERHELFVRGAVGRRGREAHGQRALTYSHDRARASARSRVHLEAHAAFDLAGETQLVEHRRRQGSSTRPSAPASALPEMKQAAVSSATIAEVVTDAYDQIVAAHPVEVGEPRRDVALSTAEAAGGLGSLT